MQASRALFRRRAVWALSVLFGVLLLLVGRLVYLQLIEGTQLKARAQDQLQVDAKLQSPRGTIFDRNGRELAVSYTAKSLYVNPAKMTEKNMNKEEVANLIAPYINLPIPEILDRMNQQGEFVWLARRLEPAKAKALTDLIASRQLAGLAFRDESRRFYPNGRLASQVLGFVGTDDKGLDGLEMSLDKYLKGRLIEKYIDTDNQGLPIFQSIFTFTPKKESENVVLTLDSTIQYIIEQALDRAISETNAAGATVIVMNPKTGEILGMANRPTFDGNSFFDYSANSWRNRAVSTIYEPGSTFKSIVAAAALQEDVVKPNEKFQDSGVVTVSGRQIRNWNDEGFGEVTFGDIIKQSINTGFVQVGMRVGADKLTDYVKKFGFGKPTGIELPGEEEGILFDPKKMGDSDLATMSIGQSIAVTPLQLITAVSAIANDGMLMKPHIIKQRVNANGEVVLENQPQPIRQVIRPETARTLTGLLEKVVSEGGGTKAKLKGYHFAGKTGTAQRLSPKGTGYEDGHYIASFVGFGPVEDPQISVLVVLDDPDGIYYGGQIAAPVFKDIVSQIVRYLAIAPEGPNHLPKSTNSSQQPAHETVVAPPGKTVMPDLRGKTMKEAGELLNQAQLNFVPQGMGFAIWQSIPAHSIVDPGIEVYVRFEES